MGRASVYGMQDVRAFSGSPSESFKKDLIELLEQEKGKASFFKADLIQPYSMLAISGGAANGAYGAGLLNGWSQAGTRPEFKVVTGISTGAIIAPFAFLGNLYDGILKEFYTKYSTKDIMRMTPSHNSLASTQPLENLIERYFDESLLREIASEYGKGRRLYVGTTNLDAQCLVIWDMGKIASVGDQRALRLFRKVILASASIPGAFPPVYLSAEVGDKIYDEMHVDGGLVKQVFFLYDIVRGIESVAKKNGVDLSAMRYTIYIIRNGYVNAIWKEVPDQLSAIAKRAIDTMVNAQSIGDIYQLYIFSKQSGKGDFNLAYIPATHIPQEKEIIDPKETRSLFDLGFNEAAAGYPWKKVPPGLDEN